MTTAMTVPNVTLPPITKVPFGRLVRVEARKMVDTRAGLWLLSITGGLLALVFLLMLIIGSVNNAYVGASNWAQYLATPVSLLVPVLAITSVTQEWGQRTAMVSFTLEASRLRVVLAKLAVVFGLAIATIVVAIALGAIGNVINAAWIGQSLHWDITGADLVWEIATQVLYMLMGFGFALLLLNTPAAVVIYYAYNFVLQTIMSALFAAFDWGHSLMPWLNIGIATLPFHHTAAQAASFEQLHRPLEGGAIGVARLVVAIMLWVGLPLILGTWRVLRAEVK